MLRIGITRRVFAIRAISLLCMAAPGRAQTPARSTSAEIRDIQYEVTFDAMTAARRSVKEFVTLL